MNERWVVTKGDAGEYKFVVKQANIRIGVLLWCIVTTFAFGIGLLLLAYQLISRAPRYAFTVSPTEVKVGSKTIPWSRVNSWGPTNPYSNKVFADHIRGNVQASWASATYRLTLQVGGGSLHLAKGLTLDQAEGLAADVRRAVDGVL